MNSPPVRDTFAVPPHDAENWSASTAIGYEETTNRWLP